MEHSKNIPLFLRKSERVRGLVLAGGKSRRFGRDKALAKSGNTTFLEKAVMLLDKMNLKPVVVTRLKADYSFLKCPVLYDKLPDKGPLGGIYTAMSSFKDSNFLVLSCDMPALTESALSNLLAARQPGFLVTAYVNSSAEIQPFPGIYEAGLLTDISSRLTGNDLSMRSFLKSLSSKKIVPWLGDPNTFQNINYEEDSVRFVRKLREEWD
jgi:molybdenum cofactor guanylyltransferase